MTDLLRDPVFILGVERLVAILVGAFVTYLGFKLFSLRVSTCKTTVSGEGSFGKWFLSGTAPGIFFMAAGVAVIVASVMCGSAEADETVGPVAAPHTNSAPRALPEPQTPNVTRRTIRKLSENQDVPRLPNGDPGGGGAWILALPDAPAGVTALALSPTAIKISWSANDNTDAFLVYRWGGDTWMSIGTLAASTTTFIDTGLQPSTTYFYDVCAQNESGTRCSSATLATTKTNDLAMRPTPAIATGGALRQDWTTPATTDSGEALRIARATSPSNSGSGELSPPVITRGSTDAGGIVDERRHAPPRSPDQHW